MSRDQQGAVGLSAVVLVVVLAALGTATALLGRTMAEANSINEKAARIAETGRGINTATDAVLQLNKTNETAGSILQTAEPLEGKLAEVVRLAQSIDQLAASIDSTAGDINGTARRINTIAGGINSEAAEILDVAKRIDADVAQINRNIDETIALARAILGDTNNILVQAESAHTNAACIDTKVGGRQSTDGHCS